jgi:hypothetical protein
MAEILALRQQLAILNGAAKRLSPHFQDSHHPIFIPKLSKNFVGFSLPISAKM